MRKIAIDPGFGGFKVAEVQNGTLSVHTIPAVVGIGSTDLGYLGTGFGRQNKHKPHTVTVDGTEYLVGQNVHRYAPPVERLDYQRLANGPELRALLYAALWKITGAGTHTVALMVGLPVEIVQDRKLTQDTLRTLRGWLVGDHRFAVDGESVTLTIVAVKGLAQPVGSYFAWGADVNGAWRMSREALRKPVAICDIGFNTLDLFAVQNGEVFGRFTGGDTLGMHRTADAIVRHVRRTYRHTLSLAEADSLMREYLETGHAIFYHPGGEHDLATAVSQALDNTFAGISQFIRQHWERGTRFRYLLITGGGAQALQEKLLAQYPQAVILPDPVTANAAGMAKFALRPRVFPAVQPC